jgi:hypothetical protein
VRELEEKDKKDFAALKDGGSWFVVSTAHWDGERCLQKEIAYNVLTNFQRVWLVDVYENRTILTATLQSKFAARDEAAFNATVAKIDEAMSR